MRTTQQYSITLPHEMAEIVEEKVQSGHYASVSEVLRDGVRALIERDEAFEKWLREDVAASYDAHKADPSRAIPIEDVMGRILERAREREAKRGE
jgi:putative addiction module CopG family antidote